MAGFISLNCYGIEGFMWTTSDSYGQFTINGRGFDIDLPGAKTYVNGQELGKNTSGGLPSKFNIGTASAGGWAGKTGGGVNLSTGLNVLYNASIHQENMKGEGGGSRAGDPDVGKGGGVFGGNAVQVMPLFPFTERGGNGKNIAGIVTNLTMMIAKYKIPNFMGGIDLENPNIGKAMAAIELNYLKSIAEIIAQVTAALAGILAAYGGYVYPTLRDELKLSVTLTDGEEKTYAPHDLGISGPHPDYLNHVLQYIKTKYFLYHTLQPFVGIYHTVDRKEYSTADCGFTFETAGGTGEFIHDIAENREIIIQTAKSERLAGYDINGETRRVVKTGGGEVRAVQVPFTEAFYRESTCGRRLRRQPRLFQRIPDTAAKPDRQPTVAVRGAAHDAFETAGGCRKGRIPFVEQ
jgi:hypothetical protein